MRSHLLATIPTAAAEQPSGPSAEAAAFASSLDASGIDLEALAADFAVAVRAAAAAPVPGSLIVHLEPGSAKAVSRRELANALEFAGVRLGRRVRHITLPHGTVAIFVDGNGCTDLRSAPAHALLRMLARALPPEPCPGELVSGSPLTSASPPTVNASPRLLGAAKDTFR